jgi:protein-disulfide isomerase
MASTESRKPTRDEQRQAAREARRLNEQAELAAAQRRRRLIQLGAGLAGAIVIVAVVIALTSGGGTKTPTAGTPVSGAAATQTLLGGIPQNDLVLGNPNAPVTLVEFADLQCPVCRAYTSDVFPTLVKRYVRTGKVKMVFRSLHFIGDDSTTAALAAQAAGQQNKLWQFADLFYRNQQQENTGYVTDSFIRQIAGGVAGLNVSQLMAARNSASAQKQLTAADTLASQSSVTGTPTFLVGKTGSQQSVLNWTQLTPSQFTGPIDRLLGL